MKIGLRTLKNGEIIERFDKAIEEALINVLDLNTVAKKSREVNLKLKITPNQDRNISYVDYVISTKLAPNKEGSTAINLGTTQDGELLVQEAFQSHQGNLLNNVIEIAK